jgi:hypothetical protein
LPDTTRISARLDQLWAIAHGPGGGADRPAYSGAEASAMRLVAGWAREAGLAPALDEFGNLWALPAGWDSADGRPLITSGSHVDTVPDGGRYDGALGTVLGLEAAGDLGARTGLLICAAEEAPRFGAGTMGSRQLVGTLSPDDLRTLRDDDGVSAADALAGFLDAPTLRSMSRSAARCASWGSSPRSPRRGASPCASRVGPVTPGRSR